MQKLVIGVFISVFSSASVHAATLEPDPVSASNVVLQIVEAGQVAAGNLAAPVAIGGDLYVVEQTGRLLRQNGASFEEVLNITAPPQGITPVGREAILNVAGNTDRIFVTYESSTLPDGLDAAPLPDDAAYLGGQYEVIYRYDRADDGSLSNPVALTAFENAPNFHTGGGMLVLPDGRLAYARGDNLGFNRDGLSGPQDDVSSVGRIFLIDGDTGEAEAAAQGIRNVQRLTYAADGEIAFVDIGAVTAEEVNVISVADLLDTTTIENFGWGRNADGNAREGTFYVSEGATAQPGTLAVAIGQAPLGEIGFLQPYAQFGNEADRFFAGSGPVASQSSFLTIDLLFGDLVSGDVFATQGDLSGILNEVIRVRLVDGNGQAVTLLDLVDGGDRVDLRFFNFADGGAGLLLEETGRFYRVTEIAAVPVPAGGALLLSALVFAVGRRKDRQSQV